MSNTRVFGEPSVPGSSAVATPRIGVFCASRFWETVLGADSGEDRFDASFGETAAVCFNTPCIKDSLDARAALRSAADGLRELDIDRVLILCSGQRSGRTAGTLFVVEDHVNWSGDNPLIGLRNEDGRERFVDMTTAYDPSIRTALLGAARDAGVPVERGVVEDRPRSGVRMGSDSGIVVSGLAQPVIAARQAGVQVGAVAWVEGEDGSLDGTLSGGSEYDTGALRRFLDFAVASLVAHTGV